MTLLKSHQKTLTRPFFTFISCEQYAVLHMRVKQLHEVTTHLPSTNFEYQSFNIFVCWFQPGLISQLTVFFSHNKLAPTGLISSETNQQTCRLSSKVNQILKTTQHKSSHRQQFFLKKKQSVIYGLGFISFNCI